MVVTPCLEVGWLLFPSSSSSLRSLTLSVASYSCLVFTSSYLFFFSFQARPRILLLFPPHLVLLFLSSHFPLSSPFSLSSFNSSSSFLYMGTGDSNRLTKGSFPRHDAHNPLFLRLSHRLSLHQPSHPSVHPSISIISRRL